MHGIDSSSHKAMKLGPGEPSAAPWRVMTLDDFVGLVFNEQTTRDRPWILAVDGRSGGGKSALANVLHRRVPSSAVVPTDDVAWHHSFFDWSDLLIEGILKPLHRGKAVSYQPPGWLKKGRPGSIEVAAGLALVIIEGVGASRTELIPWIDCSVWLQSDMDEAERRGIARDGGTEEAKRFWHEWQAEELEFLQFQRPWGRAVIVVNGTPEQSYDPSSEMIVSAAEVVTSSC